MQSLWTSLLSGAAARLDRGVLQGMERRMRGRAPRQREMQLYDDARQKLIEVARRYEGADFFPAPPPAAPRQTAISEGVFDLDWDSGYVPFFREYRDEHQRHHENLRAHARWFTGGNKKTIVCIHGWGAGAYWFEERAFVVPYWLRHGYDVVLFQLPFHGNRLPAGRTRGSLFPSPHVVRTNESFGQAVWDLRALRGWLRQPTGAMGMSLGGYTTALWASVDRELAFAVPWIPAVDFADLMWRHGEDSPARRRAVKAGVDADLLREAFRVASPLARAPLVQKKMIVAGKVDAITPPDQAERLHRHWGECPIHWFPGGHLAQVGRADALRAVRRFLES